MESKEITVARLVLGYLKNEKCRSAHKEFFRSSRHLQHYNTTSTLRSKYIPTRFVGLTLDDILTEYFEIYQIVQGRLEATNYYNECHPKSTLVTQLNYLLNPVHSSRASTPRSTPCPRSPGDSHINESSPSCIDPTSDVETTSVQNLPGNKPSNEEVYHSTLRRSKENSYNSLASIENEQNPDIVVNSEVLAQTLLENKEFHEKIAQTINKVAEKQSKESIELDETIRTVVGETEEDPIFDKILDEIIDSVGIVDNKTADANNSDRSSSQEHSGDITKKTHKPETREKVMVKCDSASNKITSETQTQKSDEVIVFDGSLDKYLVSNLYSVNTQTVPTQTVPTQNSLYINTASNLLVLPPTVNTNMATTISNPQYYLINNKQPTMSCIVQPTMLTEQDILSMPTVIVNDDRPAKATQNVPGLRKIRNPIKPKGTIEVSANIDIREFIRSYGSEEPPKPGLKNVIYPKKSNLSSSSGIKSNITDTQNLESCKENLTNGIADSNASILPKENLAKTAELKKLESIKENSIKVANSKESTDIKDKTGEPKNVPDSDKIDLYTSTPSDTLKKSTPKSGSHVRNLDFSTPPKVTSTHQKLIKENQIDKTVSSQKKSAVKSLFKQGENSKTTWDADLRATVVPEENCKREGSKRKKKMSPKKCKKKAKLQKTEEVSLNTTDYDGAILEAALKTPIKTEENKTDVIQIPEKNTLESTTNTHCNDTNKDENSHEKQEVVEGHKNKTILSPSKMNANKRTFVNSAVKETSEKNKFITPEMINGKHDCPPLKATRNLTPMLETPLKDPKVPKTPGVLTPMDMASPLSNITPFSKMLEANLKSMDIGSLPTPSIPITPSFPPFTPTVDLISPYSNRPTDYSTSSSYYQPSDSEQNKCIENQLLEIEKASVKTVSESKTSQLNRQEKSIKVDERLNVFNKQVIGKKNLSLMKRSKHSSNSDSSSNSESSNEDEDLAEEGDDETDKSFTWTEKDTSDTVIFKKKVSETPRRVYSLRTRSVTNYKSGVKENLTKKSPADISLKQQTKRAKHDNKKVPTIRVTKVDTSHDENKLNYQISPNVDAKKNSDNSLTDSKELPKEHSIESNLEESPKLCKVQHSTELIMEQEFTKLSQEQHFAELPTKQYSSEVPGKRQSTELIEEQYIETVEQQSPELCREKCIEIYNQTVHKKNPQLDLEREAQEQKAKPIKEKHKKGKPDKSNKFDKEVNKQNMKEMYIKGKLPNSQQTVLKELEEKRKRMINKIKRDNTALPPKKRNGKFKIKPIPDVSGRKRPRKSDSPKKKCRVNNEKISAKTMKILKEDLNDSDDLEDNVSPNLNLTNENESSVKVINSTVKIDKTSDVEAQNLIEGLKERGIHLMQNKLQKMDIEPTDGDSQNNEVSAMHEDIPEHSKSVENNTLDANAQINTSVEMQYSLKEEYDMKSFEGEYIHIIFDENNRSFRTLESYNIEELSKPFTGKLYLEEYDQNVDIPITCTAFHTLFELKSLNKVEAPLKLTGSLTVDLTRKQEKSSTENSQQISKDSSLKDTKDTQSKPTDLKTIEKKTDLSDNLLLSKGIKDDHKDKKCEKLLKQLNVETFLNKMYEK